MFCRYRMCRDKKHQTYKGAMMLNRATSLRQSAATTQTCLVETKPTAAEPKSPQWTTGNNSAGVKHAMFTYDAPK